MLQPTIEQPTQRRCVLRKPLADDDLDIFQCYPRAERIAAVGAAHRAGTQRIHYPRLGHNGRERNGTGNAFAQAEDVGHNVIVLVAEELAGAAEGRLYLVNDEQDVAVAAPLRQLREPAGRCHHRAGGALVGLGNDRRNPALGLRLDEPIEIVGAVQPTRVRRAAERAPIAVGERRKDDARQERAVAARAGALPASADGHGAERPAVKAAVEGDDLVAPRRQPRHFDRGFRRLGTRRQDNGLVQVGRRNLDQLLREPHTPLARKVVAVDHLIGLLAHGGHQPRVRVSGVGDHHAGGKVEEDVLVGVLHPATLGPLPDKRHLVGHRVRLVLRGQGQ